jgi:sulfatase modifying factor 1
MASPALSWPRTSSVISLVLAFAYVGCTCLPPQRPDGVARCGVAIVPASIDAALADVESGDVATADRAVEFLLRQGASVWPPLLESLRGGRAEPRATEVIVRRADAAQEAVPRLAAILRSASETFGTKRRVMRVLWRLGPRADAAIPALLAIVAHGGIDPLNTSRRRQGEWAAQAALEAMGSVAALPVATLLRSGDSSVRHDAVRILENLGADAQPAAEHLGLAMTDESSFVRKEALQVLLNLSSMPSSLRRGVIQAHGEEREERRELARRVWARHVGGEIPRPQDSEERFRPAWAQVAPEQVEAARRLGVPVAFENPIGMRFVLIPPGTFLMGSAASDAGTADYVDPAERRIEAAFYLADSETTNGQFLEFRPEHFTGPDRGIVSTTWVAMPVGSLRFEDVEEFVTWLGTVDPAHAYRLPTEEEWEYACKAGTSTSYWWGGDELPIAQFANVRDNSWNEVSNVASPGYVYDVLDFAAASSHVRSYCSNPWGLFDMLGNAWELCAGTYSEELRVPVARGGSWADGPLHVRPTSRLSFTPSPPNIGFRLVVSLPTK